MHFNGFCCYIWISYLIFWIIVNFLFMWLAKQAMKLSRNTDSNRSAIYEFTIFQLKLISLIFVGLMMQATISISQVHDKSYGIYIILYISVLSLMLTFMMLYSMIKNAIMNTFFPKENTINYIIYFETNKHLMGQLYYFGTFFRKLLCVFVIVLLKDINYYTKIFIYVLINL